MGAKDVVAARFMELCRARQITLGELFSTPEFDALEQEIK